MGFDRPLSDRSAVVTGASSGIGQATAEALARAGADIALAARREDRLREIAEEIENGGDAAAVPVETDVRDERAVEALVERAVDRFGGVDVLVNNAGVGRGFGDRVSELDTDDYETMMRTNVDGTFYATRAALPHLLELEGALVFVGSFAGQYPYPANPVYAGTNAWIRSFAHSVEADVGPEGVAVAVVNPGGVRTNFSIGDGVTQQDNYDPGEAPEPEEVADVIVDAATSRRSTTISEVNVYRRDQLGRY